MHLLIPNGRLSFGCALAGFISVTTTSQLSRFLPLSHGHREIDPFWGSIALALTIAACYTFPVAAIVYGISGWIRNTLAQDDTDGSFAVLGAILGVVGYLYADLISRPLLG